MRIDYSPPKQSYISGQSKPRPRKEPVGKVTSLVVVTFLIAFASGFGSGWFFSEKAAKKSFQAATEQNSIENAPTPVTPAPLPLQPKPEPMPANTAPPQPQTSVPTNQTASGAQATPNPQLSFYKTLPSDQKTNLMGSGVNSKNDREKQPLQAATPSNITKKAQQPANNAKPFTDRPAAPDKPATSAREKGGFTVQVASSTLRSEAEAIKSKLAARGYNVIITESNQGEKGIWYRVRVGKRLEQDAARELAGKLGKGATVFPDRE